MLGHIFLLILVAVYAKSDSLPPYIKACKRNDPQISNCVKQVFHQLRPHLMQGIPELAIPPVEPLNLGDFHLTRNVNLNLSSLQVFGVVNLEFSELNVDAHKLKFSMVIRFPYLRIVSKYVTDMKLISIPLKGAGDFKADFHDWQMTALMRGKKQPHREGYIKFDVSQTKIYPGKTNMRLENLFHGRRELEDVTNQLINDNSDLFIQELLPSLEKAITGQFNVIANQISTSFTYNTLFPL